jgi:hypothetical protein
MKNYKFFIIALTLFGTKSIFSYINHATKQKIEHDIKKLTENYIERQNDYISLELLPDSIKLLKSQDRLHIENSFHDITKKNKILEKAFFTILNHLKIKNDIKKNIFSILKKKVRKNDKKIEIRKENSSFVKSMFPHSKINGQGQKPSIILRDKEKIEEVIQEKDKFIITKEKFLFEGTEMFIFYQNNDKVKEFCINILMNSEDKIRENLNKDSEELSQDDRHLINEFITDLEQKWESSCDLFKFKIEVFLKKNKKNNMLNIDSEFLDRSKILIPSVHKKMKNETDNVEDESIFSEETNLYNIEELEKLFTFEQRKILDLKIAILKRDKKNIIFNEEVRLKYKEYYEDIISPFEKNKDIQRFLLKNKKLSDFNQKELNVYFIYLIKNYQILIKKN